MARDEDWLQVFGVFLAETREMLVEVEPVFIFLEKEPPDSADFKKQIDRIFRLFHSLKASTATFELFKLRDMTHNAENLLDSFRNNPRKFSSEQIDLLCQTCDFLSKSLDYIGKTFSDEALSEKAEGYNQKYLEELSKLNVTTHTDSAKPKKTIPQKINSGKTSSELKKALKSYSSSDFAKSYSEFGEAIPGEILEGFLLEAKALVKKSQKSLSQIFPGKESVASLKTVFQELHSFKGLTDFLNFTAFSNFCLVFESFVRGMMTEKFLFSDDNFAFLKSNFNSIDDLLASLSINPVLDLEKLSSMTDALVSKLCEVEAEAEERARTGSKAKSEAEFRTKIPSETKVELETKSTLEPGSAIISTIEPVKSLEMGSGEVSEDKPDKVKSSEEIPEVSGDASSEPLPNTLQEMGIEVTPEIFDLFHEESEMLFKIIEKGITRANENQEQQGITDLFSAFHELGILSNFLGYNILFGVGSLAKSVIEAAAKRPISELGSFFKTINAVVLELRKSLERIKNGKGETFDAVFADAKSLEAIFQEFEQAEKTAVSQEASLKTSSEKVGVPTIRVDEAKIDKLMRALGELFTARGSFPILVKKLRKVSQNAIAEELYSTANKISRLSEEFRSVLLSIRMVTLKSTFQRIPRMIRDLSKMLNKEINLELIGETTEMDKNLVEKLTNPLVHIIRNSVDHGIEIPEERKKKGKPAIGTITVAAETEGSTILIRVTDDGKGLDPVFLKEKAVAKKVISQETANSMSDREAMNLIFLPGFSTAEKLTDVSGRGVGMDVVMTDVKSVQGSVMMESAIDKGSTFTLKFPASMIISDLMLFNSGNDEYLLPVENISGLTRILPRDVHVYRGKLMANIRDIVYPIIHLDDLLYSTGEESAEKFQKRIKQLAEIDFPAAVVEVGETRFAIAVDRLVTQEKVMVKPLSEDLASITNLFSGAAIMGDGRVVLVINPRELASHFRSFI
ncbi:MAG: chemotaxis protein CheW [Candidatus Riflebacteria bacterium]|nr:chemotaxis protein CheW [Candidatus Riflebacteria bacterium]